MKSFLSKTVTAKPLSLKSEGLSSEEGVEICASRMRNSNGFSMITVSIGKQKVEFSSDEFGHNYEEIAKQFIEKLDEVIMNPCTLPEEK